MTSILELLLLCVVVSMMVLHCVSYPKVVPTPPIFPAHFTASFAETLVLHGKVLSANNGTWYYDYANRRARFDHGQGQTNNFCGGQGLSPKDAKAPCSLVFSPDENMYVVYPESMTCCLLCGKQQGCTILKPDWIHNGSKLLYVEEINGDQCYGYGKKGAVTTYDVLYSNVSGFLCRYHEIVAGIDHNLTFYRESFNFDPLPDYLFDVPKWCNRMCPHPYHPPPSH